ncbi:hypothetical protein HMSSN036_56640 [Paenibacillus macerans]|nr:hypothetical protein HMSSN036_56640 [Paenibacillus macerans]
MLDENRRLSPKSGYVAIAGEGCVRKLKYWKAYFTFVRPYTKWIILTLFIGMLKFGIPSLLPLVQNTWWTIYC